MNTRISFHLFNSINSRELLTVILPLDYKKAVNGFYSGLWKDLKISVASSYRLDKRFVRMKILKHRVSGSSCERMQWILPSGVRFDSPFDLTATDCKIIKLHLQALELASQ